MTPDAIDILKAARRKIADSRMWGQGCRSRERGLETCCAAEAIEEVPGDHSERQRAFRAFYNAAGLDREWGALTEWNDAPDRTHGDVLRTFDHAISILRL